MRVVIDTNVIVSAYLGGALETILRAFKATRFQLVVSQTIADEYLTILARPKFKIDQDALDDFAALLVSHAEFVSPEETIHAVPSDPSDNKFLEAAVAGDAIYVVSGDSHLLSLKMFRDIAIITAREFIERLG